GQPRGAGSLPRPRRVAEVNARGRLRLPVHLRRTMLDHARRDAPRECCGFLVGTPRRVVRTVPMENVAPELTRFRIADAAHIALRRALRRERPRLSIVGVYHSHPNGVAWPSPSDVADAWYPE